MVDNLDDMAYEFDFTRLTPTEIFVMGFVGILSTSPDPNHKTAANITLTRMVQKTFVGDFSEVTYDNAEIVVNDFVEALRKWNEAGCPGMQRFE